MVDEPNSTPDPKPTENLGNSPETRNPDGSIKDPALTQKEPEKTPEPAKADAKPEPEKKADDKAKPPEKYEFKPPEGYTFDEKLITEASTIFKDLGLSQEAASKLVDFHTKQALAASEAGIKAYEDMRGTWRKEVVADKDIGNGTDGLKSEVSATIGRAIDSLPPELGREFRNVMALTGAGDNPTFLKAFHNFAQRLGEGTSVKGGAPSPHGQQRSGTAPSAAHALYQNLPSAT